MAGKDSKIVWTSDPEEARRLRESDPQQKDVAFPSQQLKVQIDRKRRKGKTVTLISGFQLTESTLSSVAQSLKKRCGAGGTAKENEIEIQGGHLDVVVSELVKLGFKVKRVG